jgi:hypothetical protein
MKDIFITFGGPFSWAKDLIWLQVTKKPQLHEEGGSYARRS